MSLGDELKGLREQWQHEQIRQKLEQEFDGIPITADDGDDYDMVFLEAATNNLIKSAIEKCKKSAANGQGKRKRDGSITISDVFDLRIHGPLKLPLCVKRGMENKTYPRMEHRENYEGNIVDTWIGCKDIGQAKYVIDYIIEEAQKAGFVKLKYSANRNSHTTFPEKETILSYIYTISYSVIF